jgi:hypothetical protein
MPIWKRRRAAGRGDDGHTMADPRPGRLAGISSLARPGFPFGTRLGKLGPASAGLFLAPGGERGFFRRSALCPAGIWENPPRRVASASEDYEGGMTPAAMAAPTSTPSPNTATAMISLVAWLSTGSSSSAMGSTPRIINSHCPIHHRTQRANVNIECGGAAAQAVSLFSLSVRVLFLPHG